VLTWERLEFDRVAAFAVGLGPEKISGPTTTAKIVRSNLGYIAPLPPLN